MARTTGKALERKRAEQAAEKAAREQRAARKKAVLTAAGAVAFVAVAAALVLVQPAAPGLAVPNLGNEHIASVDQEHIAYNSRPPSSGPHLGNLAPWGEVDQQLPPELFVHNLEDGGILLAYSCGDTCPEILDGLRGTLQDFAGRNVLLMPYDDIVDADGTAHSAAAVAWNRILYFDDFSEDTQEDVEEFIRTFEGINNHVVVTTPLDGG